MSNQSLESLRQTHDRLDRATFLPKGQVEAVQNLVTVAHDHLVAHQIDRDAAFAEEGESIEGHRFDAYLQTQGKEAVIKISSVGLPDEVSSNGLFIYMHAKLEGDVREIVGIQTAKSPSAVKIEEALWLSSYGPEQLNLIADFITNAHPIDKSDYDNFIGLKPTLTPVDADSLML